MPNENPGVYNESRDRIREKKERETLLAESKKEDFETSKSRVRNKKGLDVRELQRHIEAGNSLESLKSEIKNALTDGTISHDTYNTVIASLDGEKNILHETGMIDPNRLPFSQNRLAQYLENTRLGDSIWTDLVWFLYGFVIQGSAILIIIAWKILLDLLFLPRDIYRNFTK